MTDVRVNEDGHTIWLAGSRRPELTIPWAGSRKAGGTQSSAAVAEKHTSWRGYWVMDMVRWPHSSQ